MKRFILPVRCLLFALFFAITFSSHAIVVTWTNTVSGNWGDAANWFPGIVPGPGDDVVIPNGSPTVNVDISVTCDGLQLNGSTLNVSANLAVTSSFELEGGNVTVAGATLSNFGTMEISDGAQILLNGIGSELLNEPGGEVDIEGNGSISMSNSGGPIVNQGTFQCSAAIGNFSISAAFNNGGILDVRAGTLILTGGGSGSGTFRAETGAILEFDGIYEIDSALTGTGEELLTGNTITLNGNIDGSNVVLNTILNATNSVINGCLNWQSGNINAGNPLTVASSGLLKLNFGNSGNENAYSGILNNWGTIQYYTGEMLLNGSGAELVNEPGGLVDVHENSSLNSANGGGPVINQGIFRRSAGTGNFTINVAFDNNGTLDVQSGTVALNNSANLAGGTLNFGLNNLTDYGSIDLSGSSFLTGTVRANLNGGYVPTAGSVFSVVAYGSQNGMFTNTILPSGFEWTTNYASSTFTLTVAGTLPGQAASSLKLTIQPSGALFQFSGVPNTSYTILTSTNLFTPATNWAALGQATEIGGSSYQFTDSQSSTHPQQFYRIRSP